MCVYGMLVRLGSSESMCTNTIRQLSGTPLISNLTHKLVSAQMTKGTCIMSYVQNDISRYYVDPTLDLHLNY